jgi:hypothetical protein
MVFQGLIFLLSLSPLISKSLVPIEDWISTVSFLIVRSSKNFEEVPSRLHAAIHSICLACTSPSHVRSLVDEGILGYWDGVLLFGRSGSERGGACVLLVREAIRHLTSIDKELNLVGVVAELG